MITLAILASLFVDVVQAGCCQKCTSHGGPECVNQNLFVAGICLNNKQDFGLSACNTATNLCQYTATNTNIATVFVNYLCSNQAGAHNILI
jgi:hypothetical protein